MRHAGHIFVVWGGNRVLASAVVDRLRKAGRTAVLGGDERVPNQSSFLGERVRQQIMTAGAVLVLVEDTQCNRLPHFPASGPAFRPNMMFEWGLALATLPRNLVSPALIGINRSELPNDLVGIWAPTFCSYDANSMDSVHSTADSIVDSFVSYLTSVKPELPTSPWDGLLRWPKTESYLNNLLSNNRSILVDHLQLVVPHIVIPAIYDGRLHELSKLLDSCIVTGSLPEIALAKSIINYYISCQTRPERLDELRYLRQIFKGLRDTSFSSPWGRAISLNFLGVIERKLARRDIYGNTHASIGASRDYLLESERELSHLEHSYPDDPKSTSLWKGFVYFNISRTYDSLEIPANKDIFLDFITRATEHRREIYTSYKSCGDSWRIESEFLAEWLAAELATRRAQGKPDNAIIEDALAQVRRLLRDNARAVGRLLSQLDKHIGEHTDNVIRQNIIDLQKIFS
ncbi:TIR domain-containing protein [Afifella marina]|uniref:Predicted nucleotide-binding protein containing TIR-like domain-containing protein n=1 Tax=Afifella marina DSM 2698 TaxID=1120955 RepID=A0A1G5MFZ8_AFIMA|nr:TIR domain-containing protein [Afifella marina]MBK1622562.1 hypothetical protein [Afifella marina DSM 2698]MBK1625557.1 hypothetical protein [Afifella marina]MBK5917380.1 hypothetical protein [Afifella marina]RAI23331.1 hypothetical protein CH311_00095 [Afifella marina DSM 2698]SCZ23438.1 Predicted nucleotide-binding protein containing TIR-like domain-containing protein [Afifella marina DSM 2698]